MPEQEGHECQEDVQQVHLDASLLEDIGTRKAARPTAGTTAAPRHRARCRARGCEMRSSPGRAASSAGARVSRTQHPAEEADEHLGERRRRVLHPGGGCRVAATPGAGGGPIARPQTLPQHRTAQAEEAPSSPNPMPLIQPRGARLARREPASASFRRPDGNRTAQKRGNAGAGNRPMKPAAGHQHAHRPDHAPRRLMGVPGVFRTRRSQEDRTEHLDETGHGQRANQCQGRRGESSQGARRRRRRFPACRSRPKYISNSLTKPFSGGRPQMATPRRGSQRGSRHRLGQTAEVVDLAGAGGVNDRTGAEEQAAT